MFKIHSVTHTPKFYYVLDKLQGLMDDRGIKIHDLQGRIAKAKKVQAELDQYICEITGIKNVRSPKQVRDYFMELEDTDTIRCLGLETRTDAESLGKLASLGRLDAQLVLKARKMQSKLNVLNNLAKFIDDKGYVHPKVSFQASNRISYTDPALMGISKEELWEIVAPPTKYKLWSVDIKNQEPHIVAYGLNIPELKEIIELGEGIYEGLFGKIYPKETITSGKRAELKVIWNALTYGGSKKLAIKLGTEIDGALVYKYFNNLKGIKEYRAKCKAMSLMSVNTIPTYFNTQIKSDKVGRELERSLMDIKIQGTGADILAILTEHFYDYLVTNGLTGLLDVYYTRHDEFIIMVHETVTEERATDILTDIFTHQIDDWKPFEIVVKQLKTIE